MNQANYEQIIIAGIKNLSFERQREVADFVYFLRQQEEKNSEYSRFMEADLAALEAGDLKHLEEEFENMSSSILSAEYVTDTVGLILYLEKRRLGAFAERVFDSAERGQTVIYIPVMVLAEILYLSEKGRITARLKDVFALIKNNSNFRELPINSDVVRSAAQLTDIPELHDRLISAVAGFMNLELITNDSKSVLRLSSEQFGKFEVRTDIDDFVNTGKSGFLIFDCKG